MLPTAEEALLIAGPADDVTRLSPSDAFEVATCAWSFAFDAVLEAALAASLVVEALRKACWRKASLDCRSATRAMGKDIIATVEGLLAAIGGCCSTAHNSPGGWSLAAECSELSEAFSAFFTASNSKSRFKHRLFALSFLIHSRCPTKSWKDAKALAWDHWSMDPFKLLSRSTKLSKSARAGKPGQQAPSDGQGARPQLYSRDPLNQASSPSRKRKRGQDSTAPAQELDFFGNGLQDESSDRASHLTSDAKSSGLDGHDATNASIDVGTVASPDMPIDERRRLLKQHKLKVTALYAATKKHRKRDAAGNKKAPAPQLFPQPLKTLDELRKRYGLSTRLAQNIADQGYTVPTEVQLGSLPLLLDGPEEDSATSNQTLCIDLLTVAPTGSGKTLAFMIPLVHAILTDRRLSKTSSTAAMSIATGPSAIILAPTKELAGQLVNEGRKLAASTGVHITQVQKGMLLSNNDTAAIDEDAFSEGNNNEQTGTPSVKADVLVATPGILLSVLKSDNNGSSALRNIRYLILDEADVLLDPLFRDQTLALWSACTSLSLRTSLWSATMGSNIESLARETIEERRISLGVFGAPLIRLVVGLKDSAVPNIQHRMIYSATEQGKLMALRQLLHPSSTSAEAGPSLRPPFLIFTQTIERAVALHSELLYDIPPEAGGIDRIAVLHSDLSDTARDKVMTRFRKGEVWVLVTTDLLSRGVDFRGINGVVNYDIPSSSAAYVHRVGRTGRAGREGGVAVTLYTKEDIPYIKHVANVIAISEKNAGQSNETTSSGMPKWLLDALPDVSKKDKQQLKQGGVDARSGRDAKKARISTKAGYFRREENRRKGAIAGSRMRMLQGEDSGGNTEFAGFEE